MTEAEKRRVQLLRQTRALYSDKGNIPAVHPRYQSVYGKLYDTQGNSENTYRNGTLGVRIFLSILLFALFVVADYQEVEYAKVDSAKIVHEIERQLELDFH